MAPLLNLILQQILSAQWLRGRACIDVSARRMQGRTDAAALGESAALVLPALLYPSFPIYIYILLRELVLRDSHILAGLAGASPAGYILNLAALSERVLRDRLASLVWLLTRRTCSCVVLRDFVLHLAVLE